MAKLVASFDELLIFWIIVFKRSDESRLRGDALDVFEVGVRESAVQLVYDSERHLVKSLYSKIIVTNQGWNLQQTWQSWLASRQNPFRGCFRLLVVALPRFCCPGHPLGLQVHLLRPMGSCQDTHSTWVGCYCTCCTQHLWKQSVWSGLASFRVLISNLLSWSRWCSCQVWYFQLSDRLVMHLLPVPFYELGCLPCPPLPPTLQLSAFPSLNL